MFDFKNKKVIVTGATGGSGDAIVDRFIDQEAKVLATGTNIEKLKLLKDKHNNIFTSRFDILNHEEIEKFVERSSEILEGGPDILINNAGITRDNLSLRMSFNEWKEVIDINLNSTFLLCKFSLKKMIKNKYGKIVNITSVVGHTGNVGQANYAASKSGIIVEFLDLVLIGFFVGLFLSLSIFFNKLGCTNGPFQTALVIIIFFFSF